MQMKQKTKNTKTKDIKKTYKITYKKWKVR